MYIHDFFSPYYDTAETSWESVTVPASVIDRTLSTRPTALCAKLQLRAHASFHQLFPVDLRINSLRKYCVQLFPLAGKCVSYSLSSWAQAREMKINKEFHCLEDFGIIVYAQRRQFDAKN